MTARYFLTLHARADLAEIAAAIALDGGHSSAVRIVERIRRTFRLLAENPGVGHPREDLTDDPSVRFWAVFSYLIAFVPSEDRVHAIGIVRIIHGARDPNEIRERLRETE